MTSEQIEAFKERIEPYLEKDEGKAELAIICRCAAAYMEQVEATTDALINKEIQ